jgi:PAS domain S-box-containing protein
MICRVACNPFSSGMAISMTITSGCSFLVKRTASLPFFASPTTSISPSNSTNNFMDFRKVALSSARSTEICFVGIAELRRRAELQLKARRKLSVPLRTEADTLRINHELEVHQIELEMQNAELHEARNKVEIVMENYTDLYDFAPVGYFSVDDQGLILEVNLTGAALLGIERSRLLKRRLQGFVDPPSRPAFLAFLKKIFATPGKHICELPLLNERSIPFWADLQAASADSAKGPRKWCRMAISDLTTLKHERKYGSAWKTMADANRELKRENVQGKRELALKKSEAHYAQLFEQRSRQEQLRHLSRQLLLTQEEERKRISRELHDEIVQTLVGINVHLASLTVKAPVDLKDLRKKSPERSDWWKSRWKLSIGSPVNYARPCWMTWG